MANQKNADDNVCFQVRMEGYHYIIVLLVIPFHCVLIKVLTKDLGCRMPRHVIMLSMSMSDVTQSLFIFITHFFVRVFNGGTGTPLCTGMREIMLFIATLTMVVSSIGVVAMSVERYVACIHSFHIHRIFTHKRVIYGSICQWILAIILAIIEELTNIVSQMTSVTRASAFQIIFIAFAFTAAIPVCIVQTRLFFFAKKKLRQVNPEGAFGAKLELADYRKKHIKVALVSGIVALGYIVCMLPTALLFLYEIIKDVTASASTRQVCFSLTMANSLVDPFIYGIGISDTRRMVMQNLKKVKKFIILKLMSPKVGSEVQTIFTNN